MGERRGGAEGIAMLMGGGVEGGTMSLPGLEGVSDGSVTEEGD